MRFSSRTTARLLLPPSSCLDDLRGTPFPLARNRCNLNWYSAFIMFRRLAVLIALSVCLHAAPAIAGQDDSTPRAKQGGASNNQAAEGQQSPAAADQTQSANQPQIIVNPTPPA